MRVALLTSFFPPDAQTGIARYVEDLAFGLVAQGMDVTVIAVGSNETKIENRQHFKVYWIPGRSREKKSIFPSIDLLRLSYKIWVILKKLHSKRPFDLIEYPNTDSTGCISILLGLPSPRPQYVIRLSSPMSVNPRKGTLPRLNGLLEFWQARLSDAYLSHSLANLKICEKIYRLQRQKPKQVILLGLQQNKNIVSKSSTIDGKLGILFLGHMESRKGFDVLASAWPNIVANVPNAYMVVAGADRPCKQGESFYQWAIRDMPPSALARLKYHGIVSSEFRDTLYQNAYLCVMPSRYESFGLVILEAMQYGLPTVGTNVGGIPEVIDNGKTGVLVPPDDPDALSNAIINLCQDHDRYNRIKHSLEKECAERFSIDRVAEQTHQFYSKLCVNNNANNRCE